jgi:hypothetical protein
MREYLGKYKIHLILTGIFVFLIHGSKLNSRIVGVDTEDLIHLQRDFYGGWLSTGRQGLVLLKWLTGSMEFNPYFAGLMTLIFLTAAAAAFFILWNRVSGIESIAAWAGCALLWIAHPVLVEQFYFSLQSAEICIGMILTAAALLLVREAQGKKQCALMYAAGVFLLLISFSTYQIFVVLYIFGTISILLLQTLRKEEGSKNASAVLWEIAPYVGVFLTAFLCNSLVTWGFFGESDYLSSQIMWGEQSFRDSLYTVATHVRDVFTGANSIFYSGAFGVLCILGFILVLMLRKRCGSALLLYYFSLLTTPFLMTLVCAGVPAVRSQLVLPIATGFLFYLDWHMLCRVAKQSGQGAGRKAVKTAYVFLSLVCLVGGVSEMQTSLRLYYTDACRYAQDEALGRAIISKLEVLIGEDDTPVVVVGSRTFQGNNACIEGEIIGHSIFEHDVDEEPQYYWSTRRIIGFLHTLGYDCEQVPAKNIPYAVQFAEDMSVWPGEHSVEHAGDMIVIKLSE